MSYAGFTRRVLCLSIASALCSLAPQASGAAPERGDVIQTDTVGVSMVTRDFTTHATKTVADATNLSEFVGLHYYFVDRWRLGMNVQFTEQLAPAPSANQSRFRSYALLPQIGCNFYDPFFAALFYKVAPRTNGQSHLDMAVQGLWDLDSALVRATPAGRRASTSSEAPARAQLQVLDVERQGFRHSD